MDTTQTTEDELYIKNMYYAAGYHQAKANLPMDVFTENLQSDLRFLVFHAANNPNNTKEVYQLIEGLYYKFQLGTDYNKAVLQLANKEVIQG